MFLWVVILIVIYIFINLPGVLTKEKKQEKYICLLYTPPPLTYSHSSLHIPLFCIFWWKGEIWTQYYRDNLLQPEFFDTVKIHEKNTISLDIYSMAFILRQNGTYSTSILYLSILNLYNTKMNQMKIERHIVRACVCVCVTFTVYIHIPCLQLRAQASQILIHQLTVYSQLKHFDDPKTIYRENPAFCSVHTGKLNVFLSLFRHIFAICIYLRVELICGNRSNICSFSVLICLFFSVRHNETSWTLLTWT